MERKNVKPLNTNCYIMFVFTRADFELIKNVFLSGLWRSGGIFNKKVKNSNNVNNFVQLISDSGNQNSCYHKEARTFLM